jgi:sugar/nucleoside kinase (ribokinase family)
MDVVEYLSSLVPIMVMTTAKDGAVVCCGGKRIVIPVEREINILDATGAGDVFAASLFVSLYEGASPVAAVVEAHGVAGRFLQGDFFKLNTGS